MLNVSRVSSLFGVKQRTQLVNFTAFGFCYIWDHLLSQSLVLNDVRSLTRFVLPIQQREFADTSYSLLKSGTI